MRAKRSLHRLLHFLAKTSGFNKKNKSRIEQPNLPSAVKPMLHLDEIPVPIFEQLPPFKDLSDFEEDSDSSDADFEIQEDSFCKGFVQPKLDDLARDEIYNPNELRIFIDSSKRSLKCVIYAMAIYLVKPLLGNLSVFAKNMEI